MSAISEVVITFRRHLHHRESYDLKYIASPE